MEQKITTRKPLNQNKVQENNEELIHSLSETNIRRMYSEIPRTNNANFQLYFQLKDHYVVLTRLRSIHMSSTRTLSQYYSCSSFRFFIIVDVDEVRRKREQFYSARSAIDHLLHVQTTITQTAHLYYKLTQCSQCYLLYHRFNNDSASSSAQSSESVISPPQGMLFAFYFFFEQRHYEWHSEFTRIRMIALFTIVANESISFHRRNGGRDASKSSRTFSISKLNR